MKKLDIPEKLQKLNSFFTRNGFEAVLVGGAVRDMIRGKKISDFDLATNATPQEVSNIFKHVIETGIEHGTVTVLFMGEQFEVTTYRTESDYTDGRHPDSVQYTRNLEEDLSRRDFTINAIAAYLSDGTIIDPYDGKKDIKKKIIKTVGNPMDRFSEDGLRPIRAIRFASKLGFEIEKETFNAIPQCLEITKNVSIERFRDEFTKILQSEKPSVGLKLLEQTGMMKLFIPELLQARDVTQADPRGHHIFDVLDHLFYACDFANFTETSDITIRLAALFHDIGKVDTRTEKDNTITFYNHETFSSKKCQTILKRLRYSNSTINYVSHLVQHHMFHYESNWTNAAIRRFIVRITPQDSIGKTVLETVQDLFDVRIADVSGMTNTKALLQKGPWAQNLLEFKDRIDTVLAEPNVLSIKDLAINGKDLMDVGIKPGKQIGYILNELLQITLNDPNSNTKETLLQIAKKLV